MTINDPQTIEWVVSQPRVLAVVGLSDNPERPSYRVSVEMQRRGYRIVPVNPKGGEVLGEQVYSSLTEIPFPVDVVQVFRAPQYAVDVVREVGRMTTKPKVVWMQEGVVNEQAASEAEAMGLAVVQDLCLYKEAKKREQ